MPVSQSSWEPVSESESMSKTETVMATGRGGDRAVEAEGEGEDLGFLAFAEGGEVARTAADAVRLPPERLREGA